MSQREPWSECELQELYEVINDLDWFEACAPQLLRTRSEGAIRRRMCQLREETKIAPHRVLATTRAKSQPVTQREQLIFASRRFVQAIRQSVAA